MRNSHSDSQLNRTIKQEVIMGDYDENIGDNSSRASSVHHDPTDITRNPLTEEEFHTLEASLQGEGILNTANPRYDASNDISTQFLYVAIFQHVCFLLIICIMRFMSHTRYYERLYFR